MGCLTSDRPPSARPSAESISLLEPKSFSISSWRFFCRLRSIKGFCRRRPPAHRPLISSKFIRTALPLAHPLQDTGTSTSCPLPAPPLARSLTLATSASLLMHRSATLKANQDKAGALTPSPIGPCVPLGITLTALLLKKRIDPPLYSLRYRDLIALFWLSFPPPLRLFNSLLFFFDISGPAGLPLDLSILAKNKPVQQYRCVFHFPPSKISFFSRGLRLAQKFFPRRSSFVPSSQTESIASSRREVDLLKRVAPSWLG